MSKIRIFSARSTLFSALAVQAVLPQPVIALELEEVIVTATRRAENIQDVPISISAFSGDFMQDSGITDLQELGAYAPNLSLTKSSCLPISVLVFAALARPATMRLNPVSRCL